MPALQKYWGIFLFGEFLAEFIVVLQFAKIIASVEVFVMGSQVREIDEWGVNSKFNRRDIPS
ncbi:MULTISPECIES: hypothetical protein [unclassified Coleofasciculus]|uniref:hypothetical protein n=1 Tax=unclassified Coleofasciculus TaxID=2692782 RepID=UPI0018803B37|nr:MULTISPECIES: hypothetical protein [unclassified Coleofasciculus]MBE9127625.1 hypothetical protein [Coleofasciculus sp. LEGE 07081]MBE9149672.1 hypothetical protein [Coleofasciculus sp. LEGE 07092]